MIDLEILRQQTAGSINSDPETVTGLAADEALKRCELLQAAFPASRISTC